MTPAASACILLLLCLANRWRRSRCGSFLGRNRLLMSEDGEVGTIHAAQIATTALLRMDHVRSVITLGVESRGERQNFRGTKLHAETAGLAALYHDLHCTFGHCCPFLWRALLKVGSHACGFCLLDFAVALGVLRCGWEAHPLTERCIDSCPATAQDEVISVTCRCEVRHVERSRLALRHSLFAFGCHPSEDFSPSRGICCSQLAVST